MAPPPAARDARHSRFGSALSSVLLNSDLARPKKGVPSAALGQQRPRPLRALREQEVVHHRVGHAVALHRRQHLLRLLHRGGHRLLGDHRHARGRRVHGLRRVHVVRCGDRDRVQLGVLQHLPMVGVAPVPAAPPASLPSGAGCR